jgi:dTDP-4-dehydrorhamnose 3,5-epimerase
MTFTESRLAGAWIIEPKVIHDARGLFAVTWKDEEFARRGLDTRLSQCNLSWNASRGTLRGMHFQVPPFEQVKIVRCTRGALLDVIVDLRPGSSTYRQWDAVELTADNHRMIYVPAGFAHGYLTLEDGTEAYYHASTPYAPTHESGVRWDDPAFGIELPFEPTSISEKDRAWPLIGT